jgi:hypothetical protein
MLKVISLFPNLIDEQQNVEIGVEVLKEEVIYILSSFKKAKSLGLDDWIVEFYLQFCDTLEGDLIGVTKDPIASRKITGALNATFIALISKKMIKNSLRVLDQFPYVMLYIKLYQSFWKTS